MSGPTCKAHFDDGQIVELAAVIGLFNYFNRFNDALRVEITPPGMPPPRSLDAESGSRRHEAVDDDAQPHLASGCPPEARLRSLLRDLETLQPYLEERGRHTYELAQRFLDNARRDAASRAYDERQATMLEYQHYIWHEIAGRVSKLLVACGEEDARRDDQVPDGAPSIRRRVGRYSWTARPGSDACGSLSSSPPFISPLSRGSDSSKISSFGSISSISSF